jgi:hypothetical protein
VKSATRAFVLRIPHSAYATPFRLAAPSRRQHSFINPVSAPLCVGRGLRAAPALPLPRASIRLRFTPRLHVAREAVQQESHMRTNGHGSAVGFISSAVVLIFAILTSPALAQTADRPAVKVGDEWQFMQYTVAPIQNPNFVWVITSVTPIVIAGTSNGQPLTLTPDLNIIESPTRKFSDRRQLSFPLAIGKSWNYTTDNHFKDGSGDIRMDARVTVAAYEKVTVRAGQFDAFKLEGTGKWVRQAAPDAGAVEFAETYWYAPSARAIVKQVYRDSRKSEVTFELASLKLQP